MCASAPLANESSGNLEPPTVVNVKYDAYDEYIGRAVSRGCCTPAAFAKTSVYANPYRIRRGVSREMALAKYKKLWRLRLLGRRRRLWMDRLRALAGKRLGCWCKPLPCHGDLLIKLFRELFCGENDVPTNAAGV